jgi:hypothetical protein
MTLPERPFRGSWTSSCNFEGWSVLWVLGQAGVLSARFVYFGLF